MVSLNSVIVLFLTVFSGVVLSETTSEPTLYDDLCTICHNGVELMSTEENTQRLQQAVNAYCMFSKQFQCETFNLKSVASELLKVHLPGTCQKVGCPPEMRAAPQPYPIRNRTVCDSIKRVEDFVARLPSEALASCKFVPFPEIEKFCEQFMNATVPQFMNVIESIFRVVDMMFGCERQNSTLIADSNVLADLKKVEVIDLRY